MFSNAVKLLDLDDYLEPSKECVKLVPTIQDQANPSKNIRIELNEDPLELQIQPVETIKQYIKPNLIVPKSFDKANIASINLYDCLACSGCVTSSEVILMQDQGLENFKNLSKDINKGVFI